MFKFKELSLVKMRLNIMNNLKKERFMRFLVDRLRLQTKDLLLFHMIFLLYLKIIQNLMKSKIQILMIFKVWDSILKLFNKYKKQLKCICSI